MNDALLSIPDEDFELVSFWVSFGGFLLIVAVLLLGGFLYAGRIDLTTKKNFFGQTASIADVEMKYRATFAPSTFLPKKHTHKKRKGSPVYRWVWIFLIVWIFMCGVFQILAGALKQIEVYRADAMFTASVYVLVAFFLCGVWTIVFRHGSEAEDVEEMEDAKRVEIRAVYARDGQTGLPEANAPVLHQNTTKRYYLSFAAALLFGIWILLLIAASVLQAWTLPSKQYGALLFFGPGYGLLCGWLGYAFLLNMMIAISATSRPDGSRTEPEGESEAYSASLLPIPGAALLLVCAFVIPDPAVPFPFAIVVLFFTPKYRNNLIAVCIAVLGIAIAGFRVYQLRS